MSQHDMDVANQAGAAFRADMNLALQALVSNSSGSAAPTTTFAYQFWADTNASLLKMRNAANTAWITLGVLGAANLGHIQPGTIAFHAKSAPPSGWLKANGGAVSRTTYADLFAEIGTAFGSVDSTTFNLPELRGEFLRGWDDSRGIDVSRVFGSWQTDDFKSHTHSGGMTVIADVQNSGTPNRFSPQTASTGATGGTETRPRNIALLGIIKF